MAVWLPKWATDLVRRADRGSHERDTRPMLLVTRERQRQVVTGCCERAGEAGVRVGMPLAQARALFDSDACRIGACDAPRDRAALRRLAVWAQRLSPVVAVDDSGGEADGLLLDVTGCGPVFGGEDRLVRVAAGGLARLGFGARAVIAPSFGCAWAVARFGDEGSRIVAPGDARCALSPLPIAALRVGDGVAEQLARVGIERVADLLEMPRSALPARFGEGLLLRLDQALGRAIETIEPVRPVPPPAAERVFDGPTDRLETIEVTARELIGEIAEALALRACGARSIEVELIRSDLDPERLVFTLSRPSRDAKHLWMLVRPRLERAHLGFGVEAVRVCAPVVGRIRHEQAGCGGAGSEVSGAEAERACGELLDTLRNRLGDRRVLRADLRASHLPERAFAVRATSGRPPRHAAGLLPRDRPTVLFDRAVPAEVIALTPDGPVHRVAWGGEELAVLSCIGPERIGGEWWRAAPLQGGRTRDYFSLRVEDGRWLWLVRGIESGRWYVHGVWA